MPRLSQQCLRDVHRYIDLRFSHLDVDEIRERKARTIRALKNEPANIQDDYSKRVATFFEKNAEFLDSCDTSEKRLAQEEQNRRLREKRSVGLAVREVLNGYNH